MFSFMKKDKNEKKDKKDRKDGKKNPIKDGAGSAAVVVAATTASAATATTATGNASKLTADELLRLDEVRRSLKIRTRRKEKEKLPSGITADYSANFNLGISSLTGTSADSYHDNEDVTDRLNSSSPLSGSNSETSLNSLTKDFPHVASSTAGLSVSPSGAISSSSSATSFAYSSANAPTLVVPVVPSRGILKGKSSYGHEAGAATLPDPASIEDETKLVENTLKNELIIYERPPSVLTPAKRGPPTLPKRYPMATNLFQANGASSRSTKSEEDSRAYSIPRSHTPLDPQTAAIIAAAAGLTSISNESPSKQVASRFLAARGPAGEGCGWGLGSPCSKSAVDLNASKLSLPTLIAPVLPEPRDLTLIRQETGDFGFSLRRAVVVERAPNAQTSVIRRTVIFAEPVSGNKVPDTGLLPGDRLLEVNRRNVEHSTREDIIDIIRSSGNSVTLRVQPVAELVELSRRWGTDGREIRLNEAIAKGGTLRRTGSLRHREAKAKSDDELAREKAWIEAGRVWLHYREGFAAASLLNGTDHPAGEGKVRVKLESSGELLTVDEDEIDKANPPQFDQAEDLANLRHINESSLLHTLRQRYAANLPHTYAGQSLIVINPVAPLAVYSERMIQLFRGCKAEDMPPHIYASAQSAYRNMSASRCDQSLVFVGRSASGKTHNFRNALHYLCIAAGCPSKILTVEKLNSIFLLLEAFGNCRTSLNVNATRFTQIFSLDFDQTGQIASASIQVLMPEKDRVTNRPEGEPTFHVFYELVAGASGELRKYLHLDSVASGEPCAFMTPLQKAEDREKAAVSYARLVAAMETLGFTDIESRNLWAILAAIYHLGVAGAIRGPSNKCMFANPSAAQKASNLLGLSLEELAQFTFHTAPVGMLNGRASFRTASPVVADKIADKNLEPLEALEGLAQGLYVEAFSALVALINKSISSTAHTISSIIAIDTPGFQNPETCGRTCGATFQDLCHNYTQERLQLLFHDTHFTAQLNRYAQEHIEISLEGAQDEESGSPAALIDILDKQPQSAVVRASISNLRDIDRRGFFWLLDEEALMTNSSEDELLNKMSAMYKEREFERLFTRGPDKNQMLIHHFQGTNSVMYNTEGWLKAARENPISRNASIILTESHKEDLAALFRTCRGPLPITVSGSVAGIEGSQSLRRASSIRRTFTSGTAGIKRKSLALQLKFQVDGLIETLRRTKPRFVHCFVPHHKAGLADLNSISVPSSEDALNIPLLRSQLRGSEILPAIRLYRQGYPDYLPLIEFVRRFNVLIPPDALPASLLIGLNSNASIKQATEILLLHIDLERTSYRLGLSQIFFRPGVLSHLEDQRDERVATRIARFQAHCRGYLARKRLAKLKVQDTAIRCIQRNVRKLQAVRAWPWWRLMLRLSPLLNVHRTEEELKARTEEAESLRGRVSALEKERADLKYVMDRLETKVSELTADLAEEHSTSILATERLEAETAQRMKLEKEINELEDKFSQLSSENEKLEMEVLLARSAGLNGNDPSSVSDEDDDGQPNIYKQKYERAARELEFTKQRLLQQHEDDVEQMVSIKKQLEKKLNDAYEEVEEQRQVVSQWKRKSQRLASELSDTRLLHEEQTNRNSLLEKKQRKFDTELQMLQDELRQERLAKERAHRDRDAIQSEKLTLEQTLQSVQLDLEMRGERLAALSKELEEMTADGRADADLAGLRRAKNELEMKVKDQEEELDEMAGQIQMLEAARLRLEMAMEQMRKEYKKEIVQRDDEMEDIRCSAQKKVKALEAQLESEHEERTQLVREKHELERQLVAMTQQAAQAIDDETIFKLKRDLKRTKALLKDAHSQLERARSETPSKVLLRQLRNQLEDSEFARTAAVKGRQHAEQELAEAQTQLEEALRLRSEAEERYLSTNRERSNIQSQVDDLEVELSEVMRKYKAAVAQLSVDQITLQDQASQLLSLEQEKSNLKEQVAELSSRLESLETDATSVHTQKRMELKVKELESRLELEQTTKSRLETQVTRLKDMVEKGNQELESVRCKEQLSQESTKRLQRQLRELREELNTSEQRDADTNQQVREMEQRIELLESENATLVKDLSLAVRRIEDLQAAMQGEMDTDDSDDQGDSDDSDSDSDTSVHTFLSQRKYGSTSGVSSGSFQTRDGAPSPTCDSPVHFSPSSSQVDLRSPGNMTNQESFA